MACLNLPMTCSAISRRWQHTFLIFYSIISYEILQKEIDDLTEQFESNNENPSRPEHCGLYLVKPISIELWKEGDFRTHQRQKYILKDDKNWESSFLSP